MRAALAETNTAEGEDALRNALQRSRIMQTAPLSDTVPVFVAFSPDHQRFATSDQEGEVLVRSLLTGEVMNEWQVGRWVTWLAFSPLDGHLLAGADISGTVSIWDVMAGRAMTTLQVDPDSGALTSLAFSPDERLLATSGYDGKLRLWDLATQKTLVQQDTFAAKSMAFSPDGKFLVIASYEGEISVLDPGLLTVIATWKGHEKSILDIAFRPDAKLFATVGEDRKLKIWGVPNPADGLPLYELEGHDGTINDVAFNARGDCLATAAYDHTAIVWRISSQSTMDKLAILSARAMVLGAEFAGTDLAGSHSPLEPCGIQLHTVDGDGTLETWNIGATAEYRTLTAHANGVEAIGLTPDGKTLATVDDGGVLHIWRDLAQPPVRREIHTDEIWGVAFSPDGQKVATASRDGTAKVLDLSDDITVTLTISVTNELGESVALNKVAFRPPDGKQILTAGEDGVVRLWDATSGRQVSVWPLYDPLYEVYSVAFNQDGSQFVAAGGEGIVYVWDIDHDRKAHKFAHGKSVEVLAAVFSPDGKSVVTGDTDGKLRSWSLNSEESWTISAHRGPIYAIDFSPDGTLFATAGGDRRVAVWNSATREPTSILEGNLKYVTDVKFMNSRDGLLLITTGLDSSVRMYLVRVDDLTRFAATRVTRAWTLSECNRYFNQDVCPQ